MHLHSSFTHRNHRLRGTFNGKILAMSGDGASSDYHITIEKICSSTRCKNCRWWSRSLSSSSRQILSVVQITKLLGFRWTEWQNDQKRTESAQCSQRETPVIDTEHFISTLRRFIFAMQIITERRNYYSNSLASIAAGLFL